MSFRVPEVASVHYGKYVDEMASCLGKTYVVTGTSTGLGYVATRSLVEKGAHVLCLNRPSERATAASDTLRSDCCEKGEGKITDVPCDLQSFASVREAGARVLQELGDAGLDALVCNAGVMALPDTATGDGYDVQMQTNHLSHFLLASILLPALKTATDASGGARIVCHSSAARIGGPCKAKYYGKNSGSLGGNNSAARWERYHQTKLANALFANALKEKLEERGVSGIACLTAAPGFAASQLQANTASHGDIFGMQFLMRFAQSAEDGTLPLLECIVGKDVQCGDLIVPGKRGMLGMIMGDGMSGWPTKKAFENNCVSKAGQAVLWEESEKAVGPFFKD